jgi:putative membrane protein
MSSVAGLSKYIRTLPKAKSSLLMIIVTSFIIGSIIFLVKPMSIGSGLENFLYGGAFGFVVFGLPAIITGSTDQKWVDSLHGINLKAKHSMFLALVSMTIAGIVSIIGTAVGHVLHWDLFVNSILFGTVLAFAFNILVIWSTTRIRLLKSVFIAIIQPLLMIGMLIITSFLNNVEDIFALGIIGTIFKVIIASIIFLLAIYSFIRVVESPMRKNLGFGALEILSYFILHMNEGSNTIEELFDNAGEAIDTIVGVASFRRLDGSIKALFISPCVHPGPLGDIGGSNMPTILANSFDAFTLVAHGPSTHDFNPVSSKEIVKIEDAVRKALYNMEYSPKASKFVRYSYKKANIGIQFFKNGSIMLSTFAPSGSDDIEFAVGLATMIESQKELNIKNPILVDCHNSFNAEKGGVLPGNPELFQLLDTIKLIEAKDLEHEIQVGCYHTDLGGFDKHQGIGESGMKTMVIEVNGQRTAYVLFDSNNMELGFRETIFNAVQDLDIDEIEVMTTDTHTVNTLSAGYNPVGTVEKEKIIDYIKLSIMEAINDLEPVEVGTNTERILNLKTFGPNNSTELISTISSIVAVSKIIAPLTFIVAIIFVLVWIFLL